ncbi:L-serine ammonia-lyase [Mariniblastus sp.]|nr:L-serine ammonia-lyase [Mariniblastus sp.]
MLSVLDIFRIGIGPSSSHTVGPMRIAARYVKRLDRLGLSDAVERVQVRLLGSLAWTGEGHGSPRAVLLGLLGFEPETIDLILAKQAVDSVIKSKKLSLLGREIDFDPQVDLILDRESPSPLHPNGMIMTSLSGDGEVLDRRTYYSTGGGFIASSDQLQTQPEDDLVQVGPEVEFPFGSADELLAICERENKSICEVVLCNEDSKRPRAETETRLNRIAEVMNDCINRGLETEGMLPGYLKVKRRAPSLWQSLHSGDKEATSKHVEAEQIFDWLNVYAMAVNEENAAGGQVVTAPTNGAAGVIPSVLRHYCMTEQSTPQAIHSFLLTAGGIGLLYKQRASISGAEMGCQGEVGVACSMAAAGLAAVWGATPPQIANAAEIGMEHHLGMTCDPVGGLVQIPCIERNAMGAVKAVNAARLALREKDQMKVTLDQVIETMRQTGMDMSSKYKENSQGGLAVNVVEC